MTDTNQKLREALSELIEAYNRAGPELSRAERAVDRMRLIAAHEALALPTAAPVGERDLPPVIAYRLDYPASEGVGLPRFFGADDGERAHTFAFNHKATITELCDRAALSAGDAVDGQRYRLVRRGQHFSIINGIGDMLRGENLDAEVDAAMRKGQL